MREELLEQLRKITPEEQALLDGAEGVRQDLYTNKAEFVIDSGHLLEKGQLIELRPHTRFAYFPRHRHNYVEMIYMCAGQTTHVINRKTRIMLQEGDLLFLSQNTYHEILPAGKDDIAVNFIILPEFFDRPVSMIEQADILRDFLISTLAGERADTGYLYIQARHLLPVENLIENMVWALLLKHPMMDSINQTSMGLLLMNLSRFAFSIRRGGQGEYEQDLVFAVLDYIEHHYQSGTLTEICDMLHQPVYSVSKLLKKRTGRNFRDLLHLKRIQQAAYLLANTTLPADRILEQVGYENSSYFYRSFRAQYGCSPAQFRKQSGAPASHTGFPAEPAWKDAHSDQPEGFAEHPHQTHWPSGQ